MPQKDVVRLPLNFTQHQPPEAEKTVLLVDGKCVTRGRVYKVVQLAFDKEMRGRGTFTTWCHGSLVWLMGLTMVLRTRWLHVGNETEISSQST